VRLDPPLDRRRTPEALEDFFDNAAIPLHWVGSDGTILRANRAELELLGYSPEEYVGRNIAEFHVDPPVIAEILKRLSSGETLRDCEARLRCKDGSIRDVLITSNVHFENGHFLNTRCFTRDVTAQKRMEALRAQTVDFLEGLMEGFVAYDGNWVMTYMNASGERLLGRGREEVLGKTWHEAFPHAVGNPVDHMYQRVMRTREPERMEYRYEHYGRWLEISASPVKDGGVAVYFRDITDRQESEQRLRDADRRKDEFLAMLGHELRNPLAPVRTGLHVLRRVDPGSAQAADARAMMERQLAHLIRLVDDLLEVSRISRGKIELRPERVELAAVVQSAVETSGPMIEASNHRLEVSLPAEPVALQADLVRLAQVLSNLLNNAAKYTDAGGRIVLAARREGANARVSVTDNGIGIAPEALPRVFEMFTQVDRARARGGLGIGLALARSLVEMHGGSIEAHSRGLGQGSEFVVWLPVA
jgi:PAS domain S-box-containing protein